MALFSAHNAEQLPESSANAQYAPNAVNVTNSPHVEPTISADCLNTIDHIELAAVLDPSSYFESLSSTAHRVVRSFSWRKTTLNEHLLYDEYARSDDEALEYDIPMHYFHDNLEYNNDGIERHVQGEHFAEPESKRSKLPKQKGRVSAPSNQFRCFYTARSSAEIEQILDMNSTLEELGRTLAAMEIMREERICGSTINFLLEMPGRDDVVELISIEIDEVRTLVGLLNCSDGAWSFLPKQCQRLMARLLAKFGVISQDLESQTGQMPATPEQIQHKVASIPAKFCDMWTQQIAFLDLLSVLLALSTMSYVGSHCAHDSIPFLDLSPSGALISRRRLDLQLRFGYGIRQRRLACFDDYIQSPVWVFGISSNTQHPAKLLSSIEQLADIWGPVFAVPCEPGNFDRLTLLNLEGGILYRNAEERPIVVESRDRTSAAKHVEAIYPMHFAKTGPIRHGPGLEDDMSTKRLFVDAEESQSLPQDYTPFPSKARLLIGAASTAGSAESTTTVRHSCRRSRREYASKSAIQQWLQYISLDAEEVQEAHSSPPRSTTPETAGDNAQTTASAQVDSDAGCVPSIEVEDDSSTASEGDASEGEEDGFRRIPRPRTSRPYTLLPRPQKLPRFTLPRPRKARQDLNNFRVVDENTQDWVNGSFADAEGALNDDAAALTLTTTEVLDIKDRALPVYHSCSYTLSEHGRQHALDLQALGTSKRHYLPDAIQVNFGGGQWVNLGGQKAWKLRPEVTYKRRLIDICAKPRMEVHIREILETRIGLQWSVCTGNAERVTLWDALRLAYTKPAARVILDDAYDANDNTTLAHYIADLEATGLDEEGNLRLFWPGSEGMPQVLNVQRVLPNWSKLLKDTRDSACFAVASAACLGFSVEDSVTNRQVSNACTHGRNQNEAKIRTRALATIVTAHIEAEVSPSSSSAPPTKVLPKPPNLKTKIRLPVGEIEIRSTRPAPKTISPSDSGKDSRHPWKSQLAYLTHTSPASQWVGERLRRSSTRAVGRELLNYSSAAAQLAPVFIVDQPS